MMIWIKYCKRGGFRNKTCSIRPVSLADSMTTREDGCAQQKSRPITREKNIEFIFWKSLRAFLLLCMLQRRRTHLKLHSWHGIIWDHSSGDAYCHGIVDPDRIFVVRSGEIVDPATCSVMGSSGAPADHTRNFVVGYRGIQDSSLLSPTCVVIKLIYWWIVAVIDFKHIEWFVNISTFPWFSFIWNTLPV